MKRLGVFTQDGFMASIEFLRFLREIDIDQYEVLAKIVGPDPVFVYGGEVSDDGTDTTVTDGILFAEGKFHAFTGGTFSGLPAVQKILLMESTAAGYPQPYFEGDPIPKDIYLGNIAIVDNTGTLDLTDVGAFGTLQYLKSKADLVDGKAGKNAFVSSDDSYSRNAGVFSTYLGQPLRKRAYEDGTCWIQFVLQYTGPVAKGVNIVSGIPQGPGGHGRIHDAFVESTVTNVTTPILIYRVGDEILTETVLPSGSSMVIRVNIEYKTT